MSSNDETIARMEAALKKGKADKITKAERQAAEERWIAEAKAVEERRVAETKARCKQGCCPTDENSS